MDADGARFSSGCNLVPSGSWKDKAPDDAMIIGLKELDEDDDLPLKNEHIYFAHCFKNQKGWDGILRRFKNGGGVLYDLEYLVNESGMRVAAFGYYAGVCGAAIGLDLWAQKNGPSAGRPYKVPLGVSDFHDLVQRVGSHVSLAVKECGADIPVVAVIGYKGRCGGGVVGLLEGINFPKEKLKLWDSQDTEGKSDSPVRSLDYDILINCAYLSPGMTPFVTKDLIRSKKDTMKLSIIVDVSCDPLNPANPLPIYSTCTTLDSPVLAVQVEGRDIDIVAIDHLPTILPSDSSEEFCSQLYPHLLNLPDRESNYVWSAAKKTFQSHLKRLD